jgi:flagellar FliL protein
MMSKGKEKAAEGKAEPAEETKGGGGKKGIIMIAAAAIVSLAVGAGGAFFFAGSKGGESQAAAHGEEGGGGEHGESSGEAEGEGHGEEGAEGEGAGAGAKHGSADYKERLFALEPLVVNVTGDGYNRFLKLRVEFETDDVKLKEEIEARLPQVRDALIVLLSSKQLSDITDFEGKALLKEDILERVNDLLETGEVKSVLFTEFVVQ